jgi:CubicO group peptidase (beta-lactamase class C family)
MNRFGLWSVGALICLIFACQSESKNSTKGIVEVDSVELRERLKKVAIEINAEKKSKEIEAIFNAKALNGYNGTVLIAQKDVVLFNKAYGFANFQDTIKLDVDSKFQLASLSKTFTAVAVMKLVEEGKLGLDYTVKDYYPAFPYDGVTIRSLLSHRSGLPYYQYEFDKIVRSQKIYPTNQQVMDWFAKAKPSPKPLNLPDHFFTYNNTNYAVLAALIEKVTGLSYDEYLRKNILLPIGMKNTFSINTKNDTININRTIGYQYGRKLEKDFYDDIMGDKGIYSTSRDLLKWYNALKSESILNKESLREMYTPRSFERPGLRNYGYGFRLWVNDKQQTDYVYHTGWWKGYNTIMFFDLREDFVIIVLSNKYNKDVYNLREVINVLHGGSKNTSVEENILDQ